MDRGDLANLSAFVTVADQRSFRAAASRLDVTPSALSRATVKPGSLSISTAWFFQFSTRASDYSLSSPAASTTKAESRQSDLAGRCCCGFLGEAAKICSCSSSVLPSRYGMHPPLFCVQHHLSDWPECVIELHCCAGSVGYPVRLLMQRRGGITFENLLKRYVASGVANRSQRLFTSSQGITERPVMGLPRIGRLSSCRRPSSNSV